MHEVAARELLQWGFTIIGLRVTKYRHFKIFFSIYYRLVLQEIEIYEAIKTERKDTEL